MRGKTTTESQGALSGISEVVTTKTYSPKPANFKVIIERDFKLLEISLTSRQLAGHGI